MERPNGHKEGGGEKRETAGSSFPILTWRHRQKRTTLGSRLFRPRRSRWQKSEKKKPRSRRGRESEKEKEGKKKRERRHSSCHFLAGSTVPTRVRKKDGIQVKVARYLRCRQPVTKANITLKKGRGEREGGGERRDTSSSPVSDESRAKKRGRKPNAPSRPKITTTRRGKRRREKKKKRGVAPFDFLGKGGPGRTRHAYTPSAWSLFT